MVGKFYYTITPRTIIQKTRERVKVLEIVDDYAICETADNFLRPKTVYTILLNNITSL